jgi:DNA-binding NtrC family response regulator
MGPAKRGERRGAGVDRISILAVVGEDQDYQRVQDILFHCNWHVRRVRTLKEALRRLNAFETPVVICEASLPDGTWRDLVAEFEFMARPPRLIVMSWQNPSLWAELLKMSGCDMLEKPLEASAFFEVISSAWRDWHTQFDSAAFRAAAGNVA